MTTNIEFSIGILSWKGYDSLTNSLISYQKNGLSKLTKNKFICLPEYSEEGIKIAKKFGYKPILIENNIEESNESCRNYNLPDLRSPSLRNLRQSFDIIKYHKFPTTFDL